MTTFQENEIMEKCQVLLSKLPFTPIIQHGSYYDARYDFDSDTIVLPRMGECSIAEWVCIFLHEISHASAPRLNRVRMSDRDLEKYYHSTDYLREEVIASLCALHLSKLMEIDVWTGELLKEDIAENEEPLNTRQKVLAYLYARQAFSYLTKEYH